MKKILFIAVVTTITILCGSVSFYLGFNYSDWANGYKYDTVSEHIEVIVKEERFTILIEKTADSVATSYKIKNPGLTLNETKLDKIVNDVSIIHATGLSYTHSDYPQNYESDKRKLRALLEDELYNRIYSQIKALVIQSLKNQ